MTNYGDGKILTKQQVISRLAQDLVFGIADMAIGISSRKEAGEFVKRYEFQPEQDAVYDHKLASYFYANYATGQFENDEGNTLLAGFISGIGLKNYVRFINTTVRPSAVHFCAFLPGPSASPWHRRHPPSASDCFPRCYCKTCGFRIAKYSAPC